MTKRFKTQYPGVFYREVERIGGKGKERVYYIIFKKDGKVFEEKVGRQYADAMTPAKAARIRGERIEGKRQSRKEIREQAKVITEKWTLNKLWTEFEEKKDLTTMSIERSRYRKYLEPSLGDKEPKEILPFDIDRIRLKAMKGLAPQSIKLTLSLLRRIVNYGVKKKLCEPMTFKIEMPRVDNITTEDLNPEQINKLLQAIDEDPHPELAAIMKIALYTGMRRGELLNLQWQDVDFQRGFIFIRSPKGGKSVSIPMNDSTRDVFEDLSKTESAYVFPGRKGKRRYDVKRLIDRIREKVDLPPGFRPLHGLRHVYASMLASSGEVDLYTLQRLLTHKSPIMTQRYAHLRDESLRRASNLAGELVKKALQKKGEEVSGG
jgi:integrase